MTDQSPLPSTAADISDHQPAAPPIFAPYSPPAGGWGALRATAAVALSGRLDAACADWRVWPKPIAQYQWRAPTRSVLNDRLGTTLVQRLAQLGTVIGFVALGAGLQ